MQTVELKTAYWWHCEECAAENFTMPMKAEMTDSDAEELFRESHSLHEWESLPDNYRDFEMVCIPDEVTCSECGTNFATKDERADDTESQD